PGFEPPVQLPRPLRQRPVSLTHVPPPAHATVVPQPPLPVQFTPGVDPPEHRIGMRSADRKIAELSGMLRAVVEPALQSAVPAAPPVCVAVVPDWVSVVPRQVTLVTDVPMSGTVEGSGVPTPAPPK